MTLARRRGRSAADTRAAGSTVGRRLRRGAPALLRTCRAALTPVVDPRPAGAAVARRRAAGGRAAAGCRGAAAAAGRRAGAHRPPAGRDAVAARLPGCVAVAVTLAFAVVAASAVDWHDRDTLLFLAARPAPAGGRRRRRVRAAASTRRTRSALAAPYPAASGCCCCASAAVAGGDLRAGPGRRPARCPAGAGPRPPGCCRRSR